MTSLNQADHCILAFPNQPPVNQLPTLVPANQVLDFSVCQQLFGTTAGLQQFFAQVLTASANDLGGAMPANAFSAADVEVNSRVYLSRSLNTVAENEVVRTKAYQVEAVRLSQKIGADHPRAVALATQADAGAQVTRLVSNSAEAATTRAPEPTAATSAISGRVVNEKGQGQQGFVVEVIGVQGARLDAVGSTDAAGFFGAEYRRSEDRRAGEGGKSFPASRRFRGQGGLPDQGCDHGAGGRGRSSDDYAAGARRSTINDHQRHGDLSAQGRRGDTARDDDADRHEAANHRTEGANAAR